MPICKICKKSAASVEMKDGVCRYCRGKAERVSLPHKKIIQSNYKSPKKTKGKTSDTFWMIILFASMAFYGLYYYDHKKSDREIELERAVKAEAHHERGDTLYAKSTHLACESKEMYKEFVSAAAVNGLNQSLAVYTPRGCAVIFKGFPVTYIESDWGTAKVVFDHPVRGRVEMYTAIEVVR